MKEIFQDKKVKKSQYGMFLKIGIGFAVLVGAYFLLIAPAVSRQADKFLAQGDSYLAEKSYDLALIEYKKAQFVRKDDLIISNRIELAREAKKDVLVLEGFYREINDISQLELFRKAKSVPESEYDLLVIARDLLQSGESQLAAIAAKTATEMDPNYEEAWQYLELAQKF